MCQDPDLAISVAALISQMRELSCRRGSSDQMVTKLPIRTNELPCAEAMGVTWLEEAVWSVPPPPPGSVTLGVLLSIRGDAGHGGHWHLLCRSPPFPPNSRRGPSLAPSPAPPAGASTSSPAWVPTSWSGGRRTGSFLGDAHSRGIDEAQMGGETEAQVVATAQELLWGRQKALPSNAGEGWHSVATVDPRCARN